VANEELPKRCVYQQAQGTVLHFVQVHIGSTLESGMLGRWIGLPDTLSRWVRQGNPLIRLQVAQQSANGIPARQQLSHVRPV
jgi:hypothetical protein